MKAILGAGVLFGLVVSAGFVRADDPNPPNPPNPEVAKAVQEIVVRRGEKEEARAKQAEQWAKSEARERNWGNSAPTGGAPKK
jgi:hypothetical protein